MASEIAQYLQATLSADPNVRISAELKLSELSAHPGKEHACFVQYMRKAWWLSDALLESGISLAQIVLSQDADISLRQMSIRFYVFPHK